MNVVQYLLEKTMTIPTEPCFHISTGKIYSSAFESETWICTDLCSDKLYLLLNHKKNGFERREALRTQARDSHNTTTLLTQKFIITTATSINVMIIYGLWMYIPSSVLPNDSKPINYLLLETRSQKNPWSGAVFLTSFPSINK